MGCTRIPIIRIFFWVELDKEFLTYKTKWAGGAAYSRVYSSKTLVDRDINKPVELFNYRLWDFGVEPLFICRKSIVITGYFI